MVGKIIAIDECGSINDPMNPFSVVVANISYDLSRLKKHYQGRKLRGGYRYTEPTGEFFYLTIDPKMLRVASHTYGQLKSYTAATLNGSFYPFMLRKDAIVRLLETADYDPQRDVALIDSFCKCSALKEIIMETWQRVYGVEVPRQSVRCQRGADMVFPDVHDADSNAFRLFDRLTHDDYDEDDPTFFSRRVTLTDDDIIRYNLDRHRRREVRKLMKTREIEMPFSL